MRNKNYDREPVLDEPFMLALPSGHPLAARKRAVQENDLDGEAFVAPGSPEPSARRQFLESCARSGFAPHIRHEAADLSTAIELVAAGLGMALVQQSVARRYLDEIVLKPVRFYGERLQISGVRSMQADARLDSMFDC